MEVPLIDCDQDKHSPDAIAAQIDAALRDTGFMAVRNLGVDHHAVDSVFRTAEQFFAAAEGEKQRYGYGAASENFGYQGMRVESLDPGQPADLKETFTMRNPLGGAVAKDRWPDGDFRDAVQGFYRTAMDAARALQRFLALALEMPEDYFVQRHGGENVTLRLLHYPPVRDDVVEEAQMGAGAHTDYGMLTLLFQDDVGGLEVRDAAGHWHAVIPRPDTILINSGDLLERWSNGRYRSTCHRVRPVQGRRHRFSVALFVDPDSDTYVEPLPCCVSDDNPPRYRPTTAGEHLQEKIEATHRG